MSRRRTYKQETIDTIHRFFTALDTLIDLGIIDGIQTFCNTYNINKRNLYMQRADVNRGYFQVYWLIPLIRDYNISADWLLLGVGSIFKK